MWECGLKHDAHVLRDGNATSLPMWECGLKHCHVALTKPYQVTPHVGVWIETAIAVLSAPRTARHSPCGSVD